MDPCGFSEIQCQIYKAQIERRAKFRKEFLKLRTDPSKQAAECGYVFDEAHQRYLSMKACQTEYFKPTFRNAVSGFFMVIVPMFAYGYLVWNQRNKFLEDCRCGRLRYCDRIRKLA